MGVVRAEIAPRSRRTSGACTQPAPRFAARRPGPPRGIWPRHNWSFLHVRRGVTNTFNQGIIDKKERHMIDEALLGREGEKTRF